MFTPPPSQDDIAKMQRMGLSPDDFPEDVVEVWPENKRAYQLFAYMYTQWRGAGMGVIGLDYGPLHHKMDRMNLAPDEYDELEADIQTMEAAALAVLGKEG